MDEIYTNYQEYLAHVLREKIIQKRVIHLGIIEIYVNGPVTIITGYDVYNMSHTTISYITNVPGVITKETIFRALGLDPNERLYVTYEDILLNLKTEATLDGLARANQIKELFELLANELEEFFIYIDSDLPDYLLEYPEDANL